MNNKLAIFCRLYGIRYIMQEDTVISKNILFRVTRRNTGQFMQVAVKASKLLYANYDVDEYVINEIKKEFKINTEKYDAIVRKYGTQTAG